MLVVYNSCINSADQHGVSLRGWLADWPKDRLGQIFSGGEAGSGRFCGHNFKLGTDDRRFGRLFLRLKSSDLGEARIPVRPVLEALQQERGPGRREVLVRWVGRSLLESGLWEPVFRPSISSGMATWLESFRPDIIYCQGYTLGFAWLPLMLQQRLGLPLCFQTGDDWPTSLYRGRWPSAGMARRAASRLIRASAVRLANGEAMAEEYCERYGVTFEPLMMCDDHQRFRAALPRRVAAPGTTSVIYTGSLGLGRHAPLMDLCTASNELAAEGINVMVTALISGVPPEVMSLLAAAPNLKISPAPSHEELPGYLKGADILFLPESFAQEDAEYTRLSISTKAHLYMFAERPVLLYAPPMAGVMDYGKRESWACRVDRQGTAQLKAALRRLARDKEYGSQLAAEGLAIASKRHDASRVRERFRQLAAEAAWGPDLRARS